MAYDIGKGASGALSGAGSGAMIGSVVPGVGTAIGAGVGGLMGLLGGFGGGEDEVSQLQTTLLGPEYAPKYIEGRPGQFYQQDLPQYDWADPLLGQGAGMLGDRARSIQQGEIPYYLQGLAENLRQPAMRNLQSTYFGGTNAPGVAQLSAQGAAGRNLGGGAAKQSGINTAALGYGTAASNLENQLAQLQYQGTQQVANALPGQMGTYGQIRPPVQTEFVAPAETFWNPYIAGFPDMPDYQGGGADLSSIGQALPWLLASGGPGTTGSDIPQRNVTITKTAPGA